MKRFSSLLTLSSLLALATVTLAETAPPAARSPLSAVRRELSPDALFYSYIDFEGGWGQVARDLGQALKGTSLEEKHLDLPAGFEAAGLSQIRALGLSSDAVNGSYDNRFFLYTPGGRAGFLSVFPGKPGPFLAAKFAPADADLLVDVRLDIPALVKAVLDTAVKTTADNEFTKTLLEAMKDGEKKGAGVLFSFKGRAAIVVRMHSKEVRETAQAEFSRKLPFDLFLHVDGGGASLDETLTKNAGWLRAKQGNRIRFTPKGSEQKDASAPVQPDDVSVLIDGEQIAAGTSPDFVAECLNRQSGGLAESAAFRQALADSASEGQMLVYASPRFFATTREMLQWLMLLKGTPAGSAHEVQVANQIMAMIPLPNQPVTSVVVARDDGLLIRGRSAESLKASLPFVALLTPEVLGRIATFAVRAWAADDARNHAREIAEKQLAGQLQQVGEAARVYFGSHPEAESVTLTALKEASPSAALPDFSAVTTAEIEVKRLSDVVTLQHNEFGEITHVLPLTDAQKSAIQTELRKIDEAAIESLVVGGDTSSSAYASSLFEGGWLTAPASIAGETLADVTISLETPTVTVRTPGNQEISIERAPDAVMKARRAVAQRRIAIEHNLATLDAAAQRYFAANPDASSSASLEDLASKELKPEITPVCGEEYTGVSFNRNGGTVTLATNRAGNIKYQRPLATEIRTRQLARLGVLEKAASAYFAKNPKAEFVISGEIYSETPSVTPKTAKNTEDTDKPTPPKELPELSGLVIMRDYASIKVTLENDYEIEVPRTR